MQVIYKHVGQELAFIVVKLSVGFQFYYILCTRSIHNAIQYMSESGCKTT